jgi:hypothetical protein
MTDVDDQHLIRRFTPLHGHGLSLCAWDADSDAQAQDWLRGSLDPEFGRWNTPLTPIHDLDGARAVLRRRARARRTGSRTNRAVRPSGTSAST